MKKFGVNFTLFLSGCIVALVILEIGLRIYNPLKWRVRGDKIVLPVNMEYTIQNNKLARLDPIIIHRKNALGFRGENPPENFEDYLTIVTVGGSTTECFFLSDDKAWPHVLGMKLKKRFEKLWINNAGLDGQSTFGHIVLMEDYIIKFKPKVVLFLVGINDVGVKSLRFWDYKTVKSLSFQSIRGFIISVANYSEVLTIALNIYRSIKAKNMGVVHTEIHLKATPQESISEADKDLVKRLHKESFLDGYESRLRKLIRISKENGIEPIFVTQAVLYGNAVDDLTNVNLAKVKLKDNMNGELAWEILELYNDVTRQVGVSEGVLVIDLAKEFPKNSRYYYDWAHYTNEGAEKAANLIAEFLFPFLAQKYGQEKWKAHSGSAHLVHLRTFRAHLGSPMKNAVKWVKISIAVPGPLRVSLD